MTRLGWGVVLALCVVLALLCGFFIWHHVQTERTVPVIQQATTTPEAVNPSTLSIYTSGEYGFSLFYPSGAKLTDGYSTTTLSGISWRIGGASTGSPIVRIQEGGEEVRVGISTNAKDVHTCVSTGPAETTKGAFTVGSTTWQEFMFQKVGTDNEQRVTSYRTVHAASCYALELLQPLSGTASSTGYTLGDTITSFSFANT